jgi:HemY protein
MGRFFLFIAVILLVSAGAVLAALALSLPGEVTFPVGDEIVAVHSGAAVIGVVVLGGILALGW